MGSSRRNLLGLHCSVSGGLHLGIRRIMDLKARALQIFTRNQRQWDPDPVHENEIILFSQATQ